MKEKRERKKEKRREWWSGDDRQSNLHSKWFKSCCARKKVSFSFFSPSFFFSFSFLLFLLPSFSLSLENYDFERPLTQHEISFSSFWYIFLTQFKIRLEIFHSMFFFLLLSSFFFLLQKNWKKIREGEKRRKVKNVSVNLNVQFQSDDSKLHKIIFVFFSLATICN